MHMMNKRVITLLGSPRKSLKHLHMKLKQSKQTTDPYSQTTKPWYEQEK